VRLADPSEAVALPDLPEEVRLALAEVAGADKSPVEVVTATAERVRATAVTVLDSLDTPQLGSGDPPGLDRDAAVQRESPRRAPTCPAPVAPQVVGL